MEGRETGFIVDGEVASDIFCCTTLDKLKSHNIFEKVRVPDWGAVGEL